MSPEELKANVEAFNSAAQEAQEAVARIKAYLDTHEPIPELVEPLTAYIVAVDLMLTASSELAFASVKLDHKPS